MPKVSVIIPVYNVEKYLAECLESVINQTEKDIEIICVEDCSTDSSLEILQEYAKKDSRITVIRNEVNSGQSVARNKGLAIAQGEFVLFVDSDDFIEHTLLETTLKYANDVDMVCFDYSEYNDGAINTSKHNYNMSNGLYTKNDYFIDAINTNSIIISAWFSIYKKNFLIKNKISFVQGIIYEDILFYYFCMLRANSIYNINEKLYFYRIRPDSTMTKKLTQKNFDDHFFSLYKVTEDYLACDCSLELSFAIEKFIQILIKIYQNMYMNYYADSYVSVLVNQEVNSYNKLQRIFSEYIISNINTFKLSPDQLEIIKSNKNVIVYGAGYIARKVINCLASEDIPIAGIAVSAIENNPKSLMCNPIRPLSDYTNIKDECLIIIAVTSKFSGEIENCLKEQGFDNYLNLLL